MSASSLQKRFLDSQVLAFSEGGNSGELLNRHKMIISYILKYSNKNDCILDVGCYDGKILKALEKEGFNNLYGVDFSNISRNVFKNSSIKFATYDIEHDKLPFKNKFDVVIYSDVLEHLFSPQSALFDIRSHLLEKGKIIFSVPNAGWFLNGFLLTFLPSKLFLSTAFGPWGHTYNFTFYQIRRISRNLGFKIVELSGGKLDNYAFKSGTKSHVFNIFAFVLMPLIKIWPQVFSAHIFGVLEKGKGKVSEEMRFDVGV